MLERVGMDEELACVLKLHSDVKKVRRHYDANNMQVGQLQAMFDELSKKITDVYKEQTSNASSSLEGKKKKAADKK